MTDQTPDLSKFTHPDGFVISDTAPGRNWDWWDPSGSEWRRCTTKGGHFTSTRVCRLRRLTVGDGAIGPFSNAHYQVVLVDGDSLVMAHRGHGGKVRTEPVAAEWVNTWERCDPPFGEQ